MLRKGHESDKLFQFIERHIVRTSLIDTVKITYSSTQNSPVTGEEKIELEASHYRECIRITINKEYP